MYLSSQPQDTSNRSAKERFIFWTLKLCTCGIGYMSCDHRTQMSWTGPHQCCAAASLCPQGCSGRHHLQGSPGSSWGAKSLQQNVQVLHIAACCIYSTCLIHKCCQHLLTNSLNQCQHSLWGITVQLCFLNCPKFVNLIRDDTTATGGLSCIGTLRRSVWSCSRTLNIVTCHGRTLRLQCKGHLHPGCLLMRLSSSSLAEMQLWQTYWRKWQYCACKTWNKIIAEADWVRERVCAWL